VCWWRDVSERRGAALKRGCAERRNRLKLAVVQRSGGESCPLGRRVITFIKQYARFLNSIEIQQDATETTLFSVDELISTLNPIREVYSRYHIPEEGGPAGYPIMVDRESIMCPVIIPPCTLSAVSGDWVSSFISYHDGTYMSIPIQIDHSIPAPINVEVGESWTSTRHRIQGVMVDLGYFESTLVKDTVKICLDTEEAIRSLYSSGYRLIHRYTCVREVPNWYNEIICDDLL